MLTALAACGLLLIALLAVPVTLRFELSWQQALRQAFELQWGFGLVRLRLPASGERAPKKPRARHAARKKKHRKNVFYAVRQRAFRRRIVRFIGDVWRAVRKKDVRLRVRVGLGDPADTGRLWALVGPLAGLLSNLEDTTIQLEPEFVDMRFELDSSGSLRVIPLQLVYLTVALLLSPSVWRGIGRMR